jgi:Mg2+ and Co2+ transporter CorA
VFVGFYDHVNYSYDILYILSRYSQRLCDIRELIATQLEEKRNFTSFTLTIVTTVLAPMAVMTGGVQWLNVE